MKTFIALVFVLFFSTPQNKSYRIERPFEPLKQSLDTLAIKSNNLLLLTQTLQDEIN